MEWTNGIINFLHEYFNNPSFRKVVDEDQPNQKPTVEGPRIFVKSNVQQLAIDAEFEEVEPCIEQSLATSRK